MGIGRKTFVLTDISRIDYYSGESQRRIPISVFYPTKEEGESFYSDLYHPKNELLVNIYAEGKKQRGEYLKELKSKFINDALPDLSKNTNPVVLFSHGLSADRDFYTFLILPLVEAGYMVATCGHLYDTDFTLMPDGEVIEMKEGLLGKSSEIERVEQIDCRAKDLKFLADSLKDLNQIEDFKDMFDLNRVSAIGHSLGGMTVTMAMDHPLIKAGVLLDAALLYFNENGYDKELVNGKPILNLRRDNVDYGDRMKVKIDKSIEKSPQNFYKAITKEHEITKKEQLNTRMIYEDFDSSPEDFIYMDNTVHLTFTDWFKLLPELEEEDVTPVSEAFPKIVDLTLTFLEEKLLFNSSRYTEMIKEDKYTDIHIQKSIL